MTPSKYTQLVEVETGPTETDDSDGPWEALSPSTEWVGIEPLSPTGDSGRTVQSFVTMRYRPDITTVVKLSFYDSRLGRTRRLFVRGIQPPAGRGNELRVLCEEALG